MRPINSSYDRAAARAEIAARQALDAMRDGSTLPYDHPLIEALDGMAWGEIRKQIEEVPGEGWRIRREVRPIRLPDSFYLPRRTIGGGEVRDVMPYVDAVAYVTDGFRYGVHYEDGTIDWLGDDPVSAFGEGAEVEDSTETDSFNR